MMIGMTVLPAFAEGQQTITEVRLSITQPAVCEAYDVTLTAVEEKPVSLFRRVINTIKCFFAKIADFFKNLFGLK